MRILSIILSICLTIPTSSVPAYAAEIMPASQIMSEAAAEMQSSSENTETAPGSGAEEGNTLPGTGSIEEGSTITETGGTEEETTLTETDSMEEETVLPGSDSAEKETIPVSSEEESTEGAAVSGNAVSDNSLLNAVSANKAAGESRNFSDLTAAANSYSVKLQLKLQYIGITYAVFTDRADVNLFGDTDTGVIAAGEVNNAKSELIEFTRTAETLIFTGEVRKLKPDTVYSITIAERQIVDGEAIYTRLSNVISFSTGPAVEESRISFGEIVADTHYYSTGLEVKLKNPEREDPDAYGFSYKKTDGTQAYIDIPADSFDEETSKFKIDKFAVPEDVDTVYPFVLTSTGSGDAVQQIYVRGEPCKLEMKDLRGAKLVVYANAIGSSAIDVNVELDPFYEGDKLKVFYLISEEMDGNYKQWTNQYLYDSTKGKMQYLIDFNLKPDTDYYVKAAVGISGSNISLVSEPVQVTMGAEHTYQLSEAFPDEVFRECIVDSLRLYGIIVESNGTVSNKQLERVRDIIIDGYYEYEGRIIENLKGIELLKGLHYVRIRCQDFSTVDLTGLTALRKLDLSDNNLTKLPDLSGMHFLGAGDTKLNGNQIPLDQFTADSSKLPSQLKNEKWLSSNMKQRGEAVFKIANKYYAQGRKHPFYFELTNTRNRGTYTAKISVDGAPLISLEQFGYIDTAKFFGTDDLLVSEDSHNLRITIESTIAGESYTLEKDVMFSGDTAAYAEVTVSPNSEYFYAQAYLPVSEDMEKPYSILLKNSDGKTVGKSEAEDIKGSYSNMGDNRYPRDIFNHNFPYDRRIYYTNSYLYFAEKLAPGVYSLVIETNEGTFTIPNALTITSKPLVRYVNLASGSYVSGKDKIYIKLSGSGLDPDKIWPVLTVGGKAVTQKQNAVRVSDGYVYCLKKLDWKFNYNEVHYDLETAQGYEFLSDCTEGTISLSGTDRMHLYLGQYNMKTGKAAVFFKEGGLPEDTEVYAELTQNSPSVKIAAAESKVINDKAEFKFEHEGRPVMLLPGKYYKVTVYYPDGAVESKWEFTFLNYKVNSVSIPEYVEAGKNKISIEYKSPDLLIGDVLTAIIEKNGVELARKDIKAVPVTYNKLNWTGIKDTITSTSPFEKDTTYTVRIMQGDQRLYSGEVYAYQKESNKFYIDLVSLGRKGKQLGITVDMPNPKLSPNLEVQLFDRLGNEVKGVTIKSQKVVNNSINLELGNVTDNGIGYYVRIRDKVLGEPYTLSNKTYYFQTETMGRWKSLNSLSLYLSSYKGYKGFGSVSGDEESFPAKVYVYHPGRTEALAKWDFAREGLITESQLAMLPDPNGIYDFKLSGKNGEVKEYTGTVDLFLTDPEIPASDIILDKKELKLGKGSIAELTAAVKPADADQTISWDSSDTKIVTVENGKITAIAAGTAVITASAGGKQAVCTVTVVDISLDSYEAELLKGEAHQIQVRGAAGTPSYTSDNTDAASVDQTGKVTAVGIGTASINVKADGVEFIFKVRVLPKITGISLGAEKLTMGVGNETSLNARILPAGVSAADVKWESGNPDVITVTNGNSPLTGNMTALKAGSSIVKVTAGEFTAQCEVTVLKSIDKEVPQGLYAVTNVTPLLKDSLFKEAGWSFKDQGNETVLTAMDRRVPQYFSAVYTEEGACPFEARVPVQVVKLNKIAIALEYAAVSKGDKLTPEVLFDTVGGDLPADSYTIKWECKKNLVEFDNASALSPALTAKEAGNEVLKVTVALKGLTDKGQVIRFSAEYPLKVTADQSIDEIRLTGGTEGVTIKGDRVCVPYGTENKFQKGSKITLDFEAYIKDGKEEKIPLSYKTEDKSILMVSESAQRSVTLELKDGGETNLIVTAGDEGQYVRYISISVEDYAPRLTETAATLNLLKNNGVSLPVFISYGNNITGVEMLDDKGAVSTIFTAKQNGNSITIRPVSDQLKTGSYSGQGIRFTCEDGKKYTSTITVKVEDKAPKAVLKSVEKANLFYTDSMAVYEVSSDDEIADVTWDSGKTAGTARLVGKFKGGRLYLTPADVNDCSSNTIKAIKNGTVTITFKDYKESAKKTMNLTAAIIVKKAVLALDQSKTLLYPNMTENYLSIIDKLTKEPTALGNGDIVKADGPIALTVGKSGDGRLLLQYSGTKAVNLKLQVKLAGWRDSVELKHSVAVNNVPAIQLSKTSVIMNTDCTAKSYDAVAVDVTVKGNTYAKADQLKTPVGKNDKSKALLVNDSLSIIPDTQNSRYLVALNGEAPKGSYSYAVGGSIETANGSLPVKDVTLTIKISDKAPVATVSAKGSINLVDRQNTEILYTVKLSDMTDRIQGVELLGAYSSLFTIGKNNNDSIIIRAAEGEELLADANYTLRMKLTLESGYTVITKAFKVKPKQTVPAVMAIQKKLTLHAGAYGDSNGQQLDFAFKSPGKSQGILIENAELTNYKDNFDYEYEDGRLTVKRAEGSTYLKAGKTYQLAFRIYCTGNAENAAPVIAKVPVKILK